MENKRVLAMKKRLLMLISLFTVLLLIGCSDSDPTEEIQQQVPDKTIEYQMVKLHYYTDGDTIRVINLAKRLYIKTNKINQLLHRDIIYAPIVSDNKKFTFYDEEKALIDDPLYYDDIVFVRSKTNLIEIKKMRYIYKDTLNLKAY